jgi:hypothetical protein
MKGYKMEYKYRCSSKGSVNNGIKKSCDFEFLFAEGTYHCPVCAAPMVFVPSERSVGRLLQEGARQERNASQQT